MVVTLFYSDKADYKTESSLISTSMMIVILLTLLHLVIKNIPLICLQLDNDKSYRGFFGIVLCLVQVRLGLNMFYRYPNK